MQTSIYYTEEDNWLLEKAEEKGEVERRSRSAVILAILEEYFARGKKIGEILQAMGYLSQKQLATALERQKEEHEPLGTILILDNVIKQRDLKKALAIQANGVLS